MSCLHYMWSVQRLRTAAVAAVLLATPAAAQQPPPDEAWRQFDTEHFTVTYPEPMGGVARRAGTAAERAYSLLSERFVDPPRGRIQLLLTDHADFANGFATPRPFNRITVFARPPMDGGSISYFDDWLELVITHELVHTFHLDMTGTAGRVIRAVFGRPPALWPVFPSAAAPTWMIEGIATYYESQLTGAGRVNGTWQEMVMRTAALEGALPGLGQVTGSSPVWPAGNRPYVYGARYLQYMAEVHGEEAMGAFARSVAGLWVPYLMGAAVGQAFGVDLSGSWEAWAGETAERYRAEAEELAASAPLTDAATVDASGRLAGQPVVSPDGSLLAFFRSDGVSQPQIRVARPDGSSSRRLTRVNGVGGSLSWAPDGGLFFTQLEFSDRYRVTSDLYRAGRDGSVERVTKGRRISYADVAPDGRRAVAVQEGGGSNALVVVELSSGEVTTLAEAVEDLHWAYPRWSPGGEWIAATRWRRPGRMDIVVLDPAGEVRNMVTDDRAVDVAPSWTPDGTTLIWSSDRTGIPNLFAATVVGSGPPGVRQVTNLLGGAAHPSVDPEGRWVHFASYHADGWHLERIPFSPGDWFAPQPTSPRFAAEPAPPAPPPASAEAADTTTRRYVPIDTFRPYYWSPLYLSAETGTDQDGATHTVLESLVGIATGGSDLVGRHAYALTARVATDAGRFTGSFAYSYAGLGDPVLGFSMSQAYDASSRTLRATFEDGDVREFFLVERERRFSLTSSFVRQRYRNAVALGLSGGVVREHLTLQKPDGSEGPTLSRPAPRSTFTQMRATVSFANSQRRSLSISREDGLRGYVSMRTRRETGLDSQDRGRIGVDGSFNELTGEVSAFKSLGRLGFANHVLALRMSAGAAFGAGADQFHFDVGDAEGQPEAITGLGLFGGTSRLFPVRGYRFGHRSGRFAMSWSGEYRIPLAILDYGFGAWPLFLDRVHGSVFVDGGNAWGPELGEPGYDNPVQPTLWSAGAELSLIVAPLYLGGVDFRFGTGVPLVDGVDPVFYLRIGNSF